MTGENIPAMDDETRAPGRPRHAATDDAITGAALALLREQGPASVTIAATASRSGIARTTVYRRYRDREELLTAVLSRVTVRGEPPSDLGVTDKLRWIVDRTGEVIDQGIGTGGVAAVLTGTDPQFAAVLRRALADGLGPVREQIARDATDGRLAPEADADTLVRFVFGSHLAHLLVHGSPPDDAARRRTVSLLARLVTPA